MVDEWKGNVMIRGLRNRTDLNDKQARVLTKAACPRGNNGRVPVEMSIPSKERVWVKPENLVPAPTMDIGEGTDDDPFAGLKQHMQADGFDTSNMQTFTMKPGAHGKGATLEECLTNAQASI